MDRSSFRYSPTQHPDMQTMLMNDFKIEIDHLKNRYHFDLASYEQIILLNKELIYENKRLKTEKEILKRKLKNKLGHQFLVSPLLEPSEMKSELMDSGIASPAFLPSIIPDSGAQIPSFSLSSGLKEGICLEKSFPDFDQIKLEEQLMDFDNFYSPVQNMTAGLTTPELDLPNLEDIPDSGNDPLDKGRMSSESGSVSPDKEFGSPSFVCSNSSVQDLSPKEIEQKYCPYQKLYVLKSLSAECKIVHHKEQLYVGSRKDCYKCFAKELREVESLKTTLALRIKSKFSVIFGERWAEIWKKKKCGHLKKELWTLQGKTEEDVMHGWGCKKFKKAAGELAKELKKLAKLARGTDFNIEENLRKFERFVNIGEIAEQFGKFKDGQYTYKIKVFTRTFANGSGHPDFSLVRKITAHIRDSQNDLSKPGRKRKRAACSDNWRAAGNCLEEGPVEHRVKRQKFETKTINSFVSSSINSSHCESECFLFQQPADFFLTPEWFVA